MPMKIVYFFPHLSTGSGMGRVLNVKANYLADVLGYDVSIVTYRQYDRPVYFKFSEKINIVRFDIDDPSFRLKELGFFEKRRQIKAFMKEYRQKTEEFLLEHRPDVVISLFLGAEYKFLTEIKDGSKKIVEFHFNFDVSPFRIFKEKPDWKSRRRLRQVKKVQRQVESFDCLVVLTEEDEREWKKYFENVVTLTNPITIDSEHIHAELNHKKALAVGRFTHQKGFGYLIDSWQKVAEAEPDWILEIYGSGELKDELENKIRNNGLSEKVFLKDPVKNIEEVYESHSIFILSSRFEGFVLSLLEAMSCGLPPVSFDCKHGPKQLIKDGKNGFLVPLGNTDLLAERIIELMKDEELRKAMGSEAKETSKQYGVPAIMKQWEKLFSNLINEG